VEAHTYANAAIEAVVLPEAGARLHRLRAFGHDLLRTPDDPAQHLAEPFWWGCYVMAPWCNRLEAGPISFGARRIDLAPNFLDGSAIHGQVYAWLWEVSDDGSLEVRGGGGEWPWPYQVSQRLTVSGAELRLDLALTNLGDDAMPGGVGLHPWFRKPVQLAIRGRSVFSDNLNTAAEPEPVTGRFDRRGIGEVANGIDATWADLSDPAVELLWPGRLRAMMRVEARQAFVVAASPADLDAIAVELQTHAPQGLRRLFNGEPGALALLQPGETLPLTVRLQFERIDAGP
jgi:aldose 1-epimerase